MKIGCCCGNVLRDHTDWIPFKARFFADQDLDDIATDIAQRVRGARDAAKADIEVFCGLLDHTRTLYQCRNCGRVFVETRKEEAALQIFRPEDDHWKKVFASPKGEDSKPWGTNLVGHWDPNRSVGELWFDPPPAGKGGYEQFHDRALLERRYYELFDSMRSDDQFRGARLGVGALADGEPIQDIHSWGRERA